MSRFLFLCVRVWFDSAQRVSWKHLAIPFTARYRREIVPSRYKVKSRYFYSELFWLSNHITDRQIFEYPRQLKEKSILSLQESRQWLCVWYTYSTSNHKCNIVRWSQFLLPKNTPSILEAYKKADDVCSVRRHEHIYIAASLHLDMNGLRSSYTPTQTNGESEDHGPKIGRCSFGALYLLTIVKWSLWEGKYVRTQQRKFRC